LFAQNIFIQPALFWQNEVVAVDQFRPKEITSQDEEDYALRASFLHKMFK
jgi:hypothetical protein